MRVAISAGEGGAGRIQRLAEDGTPLGPPEEAADLAATVRAIEAAERPRWVWADTTRVYPGLLASGVRLARCHDVALVEAIALAHEGRYGEPSSPGAAWARLNGLPVPEERAETPEPQASLFEPEPPAFDELEAAVAVHAAQLRRLPGPLPLLAAAESAGGLVAAEMTADGLPFRVDVHDELLTSLIGPRPAHGMRPKGLQELADRIAAAFGRAVNPDSPAQIVKAFAAIGHPVPSTRSHVLKQVDHPVVPLLLRYKELSRLHTAHGWAWADQWVSGGRFRPEYVVGGVVSGRWATRGGGALQIPKIIRRAVIADPGWKLVVADAAQLEPRVLAALSGDRGLADAAGTTDLYAALADAFGGHRDRAKIALLSAMYGGGSGEALQLLAVMRKRFPAAYAYVEDAARAGEDGRLVRSRLGRTCPPPSARWRELVSGPEGSRAARDRGRFTRNFVVQATAAEWALALLAALRRRLPDPARLVFFQHDEVVVHCPAGLSAEVAAAVHDAAEESRALLFGDTPVRFPIEAVPVDSYADAK
ncbi:bifunctional 3'-5' exonuclease/DNA polymerase [Bailinhaonella thermotolerans]|uniref:DNA-directed DNA polymerase n=1 Tax=Bailinhaonella thermotolerans TaxID=1070861 RepID=A0A3A4AWA2_9ACTN|nr:bifunctional 3'-5' exonuclease/DNA polymerase [Bailinhaonella thermotolerans]RJL34165.1 bifunctional 3'-5' exonuclease/DNA polymerase [Bailinhaonella thermotolerans]